MIKIARTGWLLSLIFLGLTVVGDVRAEGINSFVTVVNPVRISAYNPDPGASLKAEYQEVEKRNLSATWLLTYDALSDKNVVSIAKIFDNKQELGIFLEVTSDFAKASGVEYHNTGFWHHASSVFLSGYTQDERKLLIDQVFKRFKQVFGFYPTSVGSWWTDAFSLSYMKEKYGITANLTCSDQYSTDGYMIWGTPWQVAYYPSKFHNGIPASDLSVKVDVVNLQWASRDPLNGYRSSAFSTQDYLVTGKNLDVSYFSRLLDLYADSSQNSFGQMVVGLEADLSPQTYQLDYAKQLDLVVDRMTTGWLRAVTMGEFSRWYRQRYPNLSPASELQSRDLLGGKQSVLWHQTPRYRVGIRFENNQATVFDLRVYTKNQKEPYYLSPNRELALFINTFSLIDEGSDKNRAITVKGQPQDFSFQEDKFLFKDKEPVKITDSKNQVVEKIFKGLSSEAIHFFKQKRFPLYLIKGIGWQYFEKVNYLIPQGEMEALVKLSRMPKGKVLVYDLECLQCEYHTQHKPPAFANIRSYVSQYSGRGIVENQQVFNAKTREESLKEFEKTKARYVYLVKFEGYKETLPFSPGDLGVEKIYTNANAEIWEVK